MDAVTVKIGDDFGPERPAVFELVIEDHVPFVDPKAYGLTDVGYVKPHDYFVTSGDAVEKTRVMDRDLWKLAGDLRKHVYHLIAEENKCSPNEAQDLFRDGVLPKHPPRFVEYESAVWKAAGQSRKLFNALLKAKGDAIFLETEWNDHVLHVIPKNPRK